jgi:predicted transcriptional regulator
LKTPKVALNPCLAWIKPGKPTQCEWALRYLEEKGLGASRNSGGSAYDRLMQIEPWAEHLNPKDIERKMRGAWAQHKFRGKEDGKRPYSYALPPETHAMLKELAEAQRRPANVLLQCLIEDFYGVIEREKKQLSRIADMEISATKHSLRKKAGCADWDEYQYAVKKWGDLEKEVDRLMRVACGLISDRCAHFNFDPLQLHDKYDNQQHTGFIEFCEQYGVNYRLRYSY